MIKMLTALAFATLTPCLFGSQIIPNPCAKATANCQFNVTTPGGVAFTVFTPKAGGGYISFQTLNGGKTKPILIDYLYDATFYLDCPDILEQVRPDPPGNDSDSTFIDLNTHQVINYVSDVFAVNCDKKTVAYENDTIDQGMYFVSPIANLYRVIVLSHYIQTDQPGAATRENSYFDDQGHLIVTYMRPDYMDHPFDYAAAVKANGQITYTKTTVTIPINYNGFVHSDAIDHSMSNTWTPTVGNGNEP